MKNIQLLLFIFALPMIGLSQQTINGSIMHDGLQRSYILYVPASYDANTPAPLVLNFHGFGSNASQQIFYGDFRNIADTAGFIVVHPEGTVFQGSTHFNVGGFTNGSTVDDVGFTEALIDSLSTEYQINPDRVYATGMSNGGFMSFLLACQLSDRIAAIASVTGSMTPQTFNNCNPTHPMPIMQIHGTADNVVAYNGSSFSKKIDDVLDYWVGFNNCNSTPVKTDVPNTNTTDGSTVEHFVYSGCDRGIATEHYKITGGGHTWPNGGFPLPGTNYDLNASLEIWRFFARYDINGLLQTTATAGISLRKETIIIYPNPTYSLINIERFDKQQVDFKLISMKGETLLSGMTNSNRHEIDLSVLPPNIYLLKVGEKVFKVLKME